ncbi:MAG: hypothetical protein AVDCRST_MAG91-1848 [uncultured Sphingomonadaceae bacterium]|uniref:Death on curing protein, Doc toxin n=1 Tax=uncultured Sphingomonadaceae bacterium TaxID=169976 RepID=A0A6J4T6H3_9SPHN|nr:MAG: hypothetical protein AVDCRST_MAG91-1848 [uncultured Sphingomonadaceae bacterium]
MRIVQWTDPAKADLARIDEDLAAADTDYADRVGAAAIASGRFLADWLGAGPPIDADPTVHKWPVKATPYLLLYRVIDDTPHILRVRHAHEDWASDF